MTTAERWLDLAERERRWFAHLAMLMTLRDIRAEADDVWSDLDRSINFLHVVRLKMLRN